VSYPLHLAHPPCYDVVPIEIQIILEIGAREFMRNAAIWILFIVALLMLAGCGDVAGDPSDTVERYITAKVAADRDTIASLLCSTMESDLQRESVSFASVEAHVEGLNCSRVGDTNTVSCDGEIIATYGTEERVFALGTYNVVQEDGEWRWCGEAGASE
jgi:hypothetical protein